MTSTEDKFKILCSITRAAHFEWRQAFIELNPDKKPVEAVMKYWEIVGHDTAKAFLKRIKPDEPIVPQLAQMIVDSSLAMGENAELEVRNTTEAYVIHHACPWFEWHKRKDALEEDRPGCDCWFQTIVDDFNKALNTKIQVETLSTLPDGDLSCNRRFSVE